MTIKVGINGFGRIGRLALRAAYDWPDLEFVMINDVAGDAKTLAHLLEFDSVQGRWQHQVKHDDKGLLIGQQHIPCFQQGDLTQLDWSGCDVLLESTGVHRSNAKSAPYLAQGVKRVVVSAPV